MNKFLISSALLLAMATPALAAGDAEGEEGTAHHTVVEDVDFTFEGPFGYYDQFQLQRGLQVYTEVCSACHGLKFVGFYALDDEGGPHLPEDQVREFAKQWTVWDDNKREEREGSYADHFPENTGAGAPDLSLMAKARAGFHGPMNLGINQLVKGMGGAEYIYSILTGYSGEEKEEAGSLFYENHTFSGGWISMAPPLSEGAVTYADGSPETLEQYAMDVSAFLMWAAEPKMEARKTYGMVWFLLLGMITISLWFANKLLWKPVKHPSTASAAKGSAGASVSEKKPAKSAVKSTTKSKAKTTTKTTKKTASKTGKTVTRASKK